MLAGHIKRARAGLIYKCTTLWDVLFVIRAASDGGLFVYDILPDQHGNLPIVKEVKAVVRFLSIDFHRDNERMNRPREYGKRTREHILW